MRLNLIRRGLNQQIRHNINLNDNSIGLLNPISDVAPSLKAQIPTAARYPVTILNNGHGPSCPAAVPPSRHSKEGSLQRATHLQVQVVVDHELEAG